MADGTSSFNVLPEDCIAKIISFTSPKDACTSAAVSPAFRSAADCDAVWERFLPPDYGEIVSASDSPVEFSTKKELYFLLCDSHLLVGGGKMSFGLTRSTGKKCYMLCARELGIAWIDNPIHWAWTSVPESRFAEVAELLSVCWLDISGKIRSEILSPDTKYAAYLVFKLSENHYGLHGPSKASIKVSDEESMEVDTTTTVYIVPPTYRRVNVKFRFGRPRLPRLRNSQGRVPSSRDDGWMEIELGTLYVDEGDEYDVQVQVCESERLNWKKGLIVEGIEFRPKETVFSNFEHDD